MSALKMYKLRYLLGVYARPAWRRLAVLLCAGATVTLGAWFTPWALPVAVVYALTVGALAALAATTGVMVLNVAAASALGGAIDRFEAAYNAYRRANAIPDIFYEEMDLEEAAERDGARRA